PCLAGGKLHHRREPAGRRRTHAFVVTGFGIRQGRSWRACGAPAYPEPRSNVPTRSVHLSVAGFKMTGMSTPRLANLIDGRLQAPLHDGWLDVHEPATAGVFAQCPDSDAADVDAAIAAASRAAPGWAATPIDRRSRLLHRLADLVEARLEEFAVLESRDSGKPLSLARRLDIPRA